MSSDKEIIEELLHYKTWKKLYPAQQLSVEKGLLQRNINYIVIAPTASGKTGVAELAMLKMLKSGRRVSYLVPLASLVNEKADEFSYLAADFLIYPNGDSGVDFSSADLAISTFEFYYRTALLRPHLVEDFGLVVVDEFHILYDKYRGYNLEKVLTMCKILNQRIICLSATFEKKEDISEWLDAEIVIIPDELRSVPLSHDVIDLSIGDGDKKLSDLYNFITEKDMLPSIIFCTRKIDTQSRANKFSDYIDEEFNDKEEIISDFTAALNTDEFTERNNQLINNISKGVAFHHSDLHRNIKEMVEQYFRERKINSLFSTTTLAYGLNFPAKSVFLYDLGFWDREAGRIPVPTHLYLQMAGRAGRPTFGDRGYGFVVGKTADELERVVPRYLKGQLDAAESNIGFDDYFEKTILELILSGRNKDEDIINFFKNTFYNYLVEKQTPILLEFNILDAIKRHAKYLGDNNFIASEGPAGYKLLDLGDVTTRFLMSTYINYALSSFVKLDNYLNETGGMVVNFDLIYKIFLLFEEVRLQKIPRRASEQIIDYFVRNYRMPRKEVQHAEYSAFVTYYGWLENYNDLQIERDFHVYPDNIPRKMIEFRRILNVYRRLGEKKYVTIPREFDLLCDRIYHGVKEDELPFKKERGIGRDTCRSLTRYCEIFRNEPWNIKGNIIEILTEVFVKIGENDLLNTHLKFAPLIGTVRGTSILDVIKRYQ